MNNMLNAILAEPRTTLLLWSEVESLLLSLGADRAEGRRGRVAFLLNNQRADFKRPQEDQIAPCHQIRYVREFLLAAGVRP